MQEYGQDKKQAKQNGQNRQKAAKNKYHLQMVNQPLIDAFVFYSFHETKTNKN